MKKNTVLIEYCKRCAHFRCKHLFRTINKCSTLVNDDVAEVCCGINMGGTLELENTSEIKKNCLNLYCKTCAHFRCKHLFQTIHKYSTLINDDVAEVCCGINMGRTPELLDDYLAAFTPIGVQGNNEVPPRRPVLGQSLVVTQLWPTSFRCTSTVLRPVVFGRALFVLVFTFFQISYITVH